MNLFKSFGIYAFAMIVASIIKFLLLPYYSNSLSVEDFGVMSIMMSIIPIMTVLLTCSLESVYSIKYYKYSNDERKNVLLTIFIFITCFLFVFLFILNCGGYKILSFIFTGITLKQWCLLSLTTYFMGLNGFLTLYYRIEMQTKVYSFILIFQNLLNLILLIFYITFLGHGVDGYIEGNLLSSLIICVSLLIMYHKKNGIILTRFENDKFRELLKLSAPIIIGMLFNNILNVGDRVILEKMTGSFYDVGQYTMGYRIGELFNTFFTTTFLLVINPLLFKTFPASVDNYKDLLNKVLEIFIVIGVTLILLYNANLSWLLKYIIGEEYLESYWIIIMIACSFFIYSFGQIYAYTILLNEKIGYTTKFSIICTIVNIVLNFLLIPYFGSYGATFSTLLSYIILSICQYKYANSLLNIEFAFKKNIKFIIYGYIVFLLQYFISFLNNEFFIFIFNNLIIGVFILFIIFMKVYPYISDYVFEFFNKYKKTKFKINRNT